VGPGGKGSGPLFSYGLEKSLFSPEVGKKGKKKEVAGSLCLEVEKEGPTVSVKGRGRLKVTCQNLYEKKGKEKEGGRDFAD